MKKRYLIIMVMCLIIIISTTSYAYFKTRIKGDGSTISITGGKLNLVINENKINLTNQFPIYDTQKDTKASKNEFSITLSGSGVTTACYNLYLDVDNIGTNLQNKFLKYELSDGTNAYVGNFDGVASGTKILMVRNESLSSSSPSKNYTLRLWLSYSETEDQSFILTGDEASRTFEGKLHITGTTGECKSKTLAEAMLEDNKVLSDRTNFNGINVSNTTGRIYQTNKTEDESTVYYYSGNTTNNWVKFGKESTQCTYSGYLVRVAGEIYEMGDDEPSFLYLTDRVKNMEECVSTNVCLSNVYGPVVGLTEADCISIAGKWTDDKAIYDEASKKDIYWRIIRTNEDGSVRLLYSGTSPDTTIAYIGTSEYNSSYNNPMYVGYMYGISGSLENNRTNTNDSTIKIYIDKWYQNNLLNDFDKYISKTAIYCNDRSVASDQVYSTSISFNYGPNTRLEVNKMPTYKCGGDGNDGLFETSQAVEDKFSASTEGGGNGKLTYPVALMSADEISFAGGRRSQLLNVPYAWYYTNSEGNSIMSNESWWLISPKSSNYMFRSDDLNNGTIGVSIMSSPSAVRPALSLLSCVKVTGNGTSFSPYEIDYEGSCN